MSKRLIILEKKHEIKDREDVIIPEISLVNL